MRGPPASVHAWILCLTLYAQVVLFFLVSMQREVIAPTRMINVLWNHLTVIAYTLLLV